MWKTLLRCGIVGGIIVFLWLMISWMVLPLHTGAMNRFTNESEVVSNVTRYAPKDGIYVIPNMETRQEPSTNQTLIFMNIKRGININEMTESMICGILTQIIAAMFVAYLLVKAKARKYWDRVWFVTVVGIFAALVGVLPSWNWWHFPFGWVMIEFFDVVIGWFLAGLVMSKLYKN